MASNPQETESLRPGDLVLDRYRVNHLIATGGHSHVYLGRDERLARPVCIKVFSRLQSEGGISRASYEHFIQEAFALSRLTHPNTLRIYDFGHLAMPERGERGEVPVQVCEFLSGGTVAALVRAKGRLSLKEAVPVVRAICDSLAEAHQQGIVHRDIKPQNVLFAEVGSERLPKLADFGIAKWADESADAHRAPDTKVAAGSNLAMYSPSWAAPEQLVAEAVGPATDIYSLALLTVYMLTGQAIVAHDDVFESYRLRRAADELTREACMELGISDVIIRHLCRALAFDPAHRPQSVREFLQPFLASVEERQLEPAPNLSVSIPPPVAATKSMSPATYMSPATGAWTVDNRLVAFLETMSDAAVVTDNTTGLRMRVARVVGVGGAHLIHLRPLSSFISHGGARPTSAIQLATDSTVDLTTPRQEVLGRAFVSFGRTENGYRVFDLGGVAIALSLRECPDAVLVDFGSGHNAYFVYTAPSGSPRPTRKRAMSRSKG